MAAVDYFLKIDGVDGESTDDKHKGEIDVESFSWGVTQTGTAAAGGGGGTGKVIMQDIHFTKFLDKATPKLWLKCATGEHIKQAVLVGVAAAGDPIEVTGAALQRADSQFLKLTFSDVLVSSFQENGVNAGIVDQLAFQYASAKMETTPGATVAITPDATGNIVVDPKTGRPVEGGGQTGVLTSGPILNLDGILIGLSRGILEFSLKDVRGILNSPGGHGLFFTCREFRPAQEQPPGDIINVDAVLTTPDMVGPQKKLDRHDLYWYAPADLVLTGEDFFRQGKKLGSLVVDPSDPSSELAEATFDLTEIAAANDTIGIRIQSAMDHTALMEEEGLVATPEPHLGEDGPPFTINAASFTASLELVMA